MKKEMDIIISSFVTGILGAFLGYYLSYIKSKATNRALKEDIAYITHEKEKITHEFNLQKERRKHQYEKKHEVYSRYHNLLDKIESQNKLLDSKVTSYLMSDLTNTLYSNISDEGMKMKAINKFGNAIDELLFDSITGLKEAINQTNEIKLIGCPELMLNIKQLDENYNRLINLSNNVFKDPLKVVSGTIDFEALNVEIDTVKTNVEKLKEECLTLMRKDLERI